MKTVDVNLGDRSYPILIELDILSRIGEIVAERYSGKQIAVISDQTVSGHYGETVMSNLRDRDLEVRLYTVMDGEDSKSWQIMGQLLTELIQSGLKRDGLVIALGGGVVGDLAGFVAATYLRGVDFIQVPTSLLAQVDSSVGGKVGINHALGKNLIGNFYQPQKVLIDPLTLKTLDKREFWAGMGEVLKYGCIWSEPFFNQIENNLDNYAALSESELIDMLAFCCRAKADVVEADEKEGGLRRILNFGHTLGHALEAATDYHQFKHGEAVVHGMHWAAWVSFREGLLPQSDFERIAALLKRIPVPLIPKEMTGQQLESKTRIDKKQTGSGLHLVLLEAIGQTKQVKVGNLHDRIMQWLQQYRFWNQDG